LAFDFEELAAGRRKREAKPSLESKIGKQRLQTKSGHVKGKRIKPFVFRKSLLAY